MTTHCFGLYLTRYCYWWLTSRRYLLRNRNFKRFYCQLMRNTDWLGSNSRNLSNWLTWPWTDINGRRMGNDKSCVSWLRLRDYYFRNLRLYRHRGNLYRLFLNYLTWPWSDINARGMRNRWHHVLGLDKAHYF